MSSNEIYSGFKTIERGLETYVSRTDAKSFIESCKAKGIGILGLDGIFCKEGITESPISMIIDFSELKNDLPACDFVNVTCDRSQKFVSEFPVDDDLYIDFVLDD